VQYCFDDSLFKLSRHMVLIPYLSMLAGQLYSQKLIDSGLWQCKWLAWIDLTQILVDLFI
jgi:hypothetical protein